MLALSLASWIDGAIICSAGVYFTLLGFRKIGKQPGVDARTDLMHQRHGVLFKVVGPILAVSGLALAIVGAMRPPT